MTDTELNFAFPPEHPGAFLRKDVLPELGMTQKAFAEHIRISRNTLSKVLHERQPITLELAMKIGQALGNGTRFWLALQMQHDIWEIEQEEKKIEIELLDWKKRAA